MKKITFLTAILLLTTSCNKAENKPKNAHSNKAETVLFNDKDYVLNSDFPVGDVRRYGVFPDSSYASIHPFTKEPKITTVLNLCEQQGIEMFFPKGYYGTALILDSRKNMTLKFDEAEFDIIHITHNSESKIGPENITLKGRVITYDRLGITEALNINIDTVYIKTDKTKNLRKLRSRGCHIYHGCKNISIKYLEIDDFGSGNVDYQHNHAALAIDGWKNNPVNVQIKKVYIKSTDRHGVYITGTDHIIDEIVIDKFGMGSSDGMSPMQDAAAGEEKDFKAVWINRCYDSFIERLIINEKESKGKYTAHFDEGNASRPFTIGYFKVINDNPQIEILKNDNTGVIVEVMD